MLLGREELKTEEIDIPIVSKMVDKPSIYSKAIVVTEFHNYVKTSVANGELERQHAVSNIAQKLP